MNLRKISEVLKRTADDSIIHKNDVENIINALKENVTAALEQALKSNDSDFKIEILDFDENYEIELFNDRIILNFKNVKIFEKSTNRFHPSEKQDLKKVTIVKNFSKKEWELGA